ncbi:MAG: hypothetical protein EWM72_00931 [Nitrospira sp.]|nr:MAG: hypothetical protein EWM72_00931 [Nitrospira sp.]
MRASLYTRGLQYIGALLSLCLLVTGCSMFYGGSTVHKSAKGSVHLNEVADWSFEASHPAMIDQMTMLKVVKGVVADDVMKAPANMPAGGSKPMRAFSDEDAEFLAPLLAQGLSQARPEQIVGFTVSPSAGSGTEPTAGTLYVQQGSIYLTIAPSRSKKALGFMPSSAARIEKAPSYAAAWAVGAMSMVIDYQALAKAPMPGAIPVAATPKPMPASPVPATPIAKATPKQEAPIAVQSLATSNPASSDPGSSEMSNDELLSKKLDELRQARESNKMKESEIAILKKEVEWMKQELRERTAEVKAIKANKGAGHSAPKKKTAEAYPTH